MAEGWTIESVLKKHGLWRELAGPAAGPTAIKLQWQDMQIEKLRALLVEVYNHGENGDLHSRIGDALGAAPGEDAI